MTVCIAALAAETKAIVCVADKAVTYGDYLQWDAESGKIIKLNPSGSVVMFSDEGTAPRVLSKFFEKANEVGGNKINETVEVCEDQYRAAVRDLTEAIFLKPRFLDRSDYTKAITAPKVNHLMRGLADEIKAFNMKCDLLVCGYDINKIPFILDLVSPGIATDYGMDGFRAIGAGWEKAISRLLFSEHKREHSIGRVLYDCFDAKVNAEMVPSVGYDWDAVVITRSQCFKVDKDIKDIIECVWAKYNRSPFDKFNRKEDMSVPKDWREKLEKFSGSLL